MSANCLGGGGGGGRELRVKNLGRTSLVTPCAVFTSSKGGGGGRFWQFLPLPNEALVARVRACNSVNLKLGRNYHQPKIVTCYKSIKTY